MARIAEHVLGVVPVAVEAQHVSVVVEELTQCVVFLVRSQWLHRLIQLQDNHCDVKVSMTLVAEHAVGVKLAVLWRD